MSNLIIIKDNNILNTFIINEDTTIQFLHNNALIDEYKYNYELLDNNRIQIFNDTINLIFHLEVIDKNSINLKNKLLEIKLSKSINNMPVNIYYSN